MTSSSFIDVEDMPDAIVAAMPRGSSSSFARSVRGSVYSSLTDRMAEIETEVFPFHVGDTWMEPPEGCRLEDLSVATHPGMHRYVSPSGHPPLVDALLQRTRERTGVRIEPANIQIVGGATLGLGVVMGTLLDPGEEVLILAPYWPLIEGIVRAFRAEPRIVPFDHVTTPSDAVERLERSVSKRTAALYFGFPNNPSGVVVDRLVVEAMVEWASRHDLWVVSDEVYEDYVYRGEAPSALSIAPDRTLTVHSFSKAYGMAGNRCGWITAPSSLRAELLKLSTHTIYSAPTASQITALRVLERGDDWLARARERYRQISEAVAARLNVAPPDGGTFLFLDVSAALDERGLLGFLEDCADAGVFLAPGPSFGPYESHARLCFTAVPPDATERGVEVLARLLER